MFLRALDALSHQVTFGELGADGNLGYGNLLVSVCGRHYPGAISAHPPSRLTFKIPDHSGSFRAYVALNDSSEPRACADFSVKVDGELVGCAPRVRPGEPPRLIEADVRGGSTLELSADAQPWGGCHGLWIDPSFGPMTDFVRTALPSVRLVRPHQPLRTDKCIVSIVTPDYADMADNFFGSLWKNGGCSDASVVLLCPEVTKEVQLLADRVNASVLALDLSDTSTYAMKCAAYSVAQVVRANSYLIADVDMLVLQPLSEVFGALKASLPDAVLICREQSGDPQQTAWSALFGGGHPYFGSESDARDLCTDRAQAEKMFAVNGGLMAATRRGLLSLENLMMDMLPRSAAWEMANPEVKWREQGLLNIALSRLGSAVELSGAYNIQMAVSDNAVDSPVMSSPTAAAGEGAARVVHFNGARGRAMYDSVRLKFRGIPNIKFGGESHPEQREADVLASRAFRAGYRVSACASFPTPDSYWENEPIWSAIWREVASRSKPLVLELDCFAGAAGALVARAAPARRGASVHLSQSERPSWLNFASGSTISGDVEANLAKMVKDGSSFDVVILDTSENQRRIYTMLNLVRACIKPGGVVLLHDVSHPVNDISAILDKARELGYSDSPAALHKHGGLYALKLPE